MGKIALIGMGLAIITASSALTQENATTVTIGNTSKDHVVVYINVESAFMPHTYIVPLPAGGVMYNIPLSQAPDDQLIIAYRGKLVGSNVERASPIEILGYRRININQFVFPTAFIEFKGGGDPCTAFSIPLRKDLKKSLEEAMRVDKKTDYQVLTKTKAK